MNSYLLIAIIASFAICIQAESVLQVQMPYAKPITLNCTNVTGGTWYLHNLTDHTVTAITANSKYTINADNSLTISELRSPELTSEYYCNSTGGAVRIIPKPEPYMYAREKSSITVTEGGYTLIACRMIVGFQQNQTITWDWKLNNEPLVNGDRVEIKTSGTNNSTGELTLRKITLNDKGIVTCTVSNGNGNYTQEIQLRVKNTLAALWPFLAIVGEVIILCIIILVFEKKCAKKSTTSEDEAENLMSKQKDNNNSELKKRSVKA